MSPYEPIEIFVSYLAAGIVGVTLAIPLAIAINRVEKEVYAVALAIIGMAVILISSMATVLFILSRYDLNLW